MCAYVSWYAFSAMNSRKNYNENELFTNWPDLEYDAPSLRCNVAGRNASESSYDSVLAVLSWELIDLQQATLDSRLDQHFTLFAGESWRTATFSTPVLHVRKQALSLA